MGRNQGSKVRVMTEEVTSPQSHSAQRIVLPAAANLPAELPTYLLRMHPHGAEHLTAHRKLQGAMEHSMTLSALTGLAK